MAAKLRRLVIDRVDLVDKGANPDAHIVLFKRDDPTDGPLIPLLDTFIDKAGRMIAGARLDRLKAAVATLQRICEEAEPEQMVLPMKHDPMTLDKGETDMAETVEGVTKRAETAEAQASELSKQVEALEKRQAELVAEVEKLQPVDEWAGIPVELRKRIEANEARVTKAEAEVRKRDCITQVRKYDKLPINPDDHWVMFDALNGLTDDVKKQVFEVFDSAQEVARQSGLFEAQGIRGDGNGGVGAYAKMDAQARKMVADGVVKTFEQGMDRIMQDQPELYAQSEVERRGV